MVTSRLCNPSATRRIVINGSSGDVLECSTTSEIACLNGVFAPLMDTKSMRFTVGLKLKANSDHIVVDAEDALVAALKVKMDRPDARIMYVRPANRRGDTRHPGRAFAKADGG
jgi:hypothetical protein